MTDAVVLDVEGTTSAVEHVHAVLFPYARARLAQWVARHGDERQTRALLDEVDRSCGRPAGGDDEATVATLVEWADSDRKHASLKALQGLIWHEGYVNGDLSGHVYGDTLPALRTWRGREARIYIYSSGSVQAQQDLFAHTQFGDLRAWLTGYFDTSSAGGKLSTASYRSIARSIETPSARVLFASDSVPELDSARAAGWRTAWVARPEECGSPNGPDRSPAADHPRYRNLLDLAEEIGR
ncbi:acireductone synthase [Streptomyces sp. NBC_01304]|uniref:acireductone synthase n=1 Tax=Streptomyces sp. NBC_01304 TaxID=2903818 RepID=UPI002E146063|nr:acireductone synthase [Streptomyces sp. NBC_01304]